MSEPRNEIPSTAKNLAVFIDADNLCDPTALDHVLRSLRTMADRVIYRRAYGRSESLKAINAVLWAHGVRPVANLIVDKVTTDSALVIDAVEAVCTNDIGIVAICSGDADFVPLAIWLREKGCYVICYSLSHKIFENAKSFYDDVVLIDVVEAVVPAPQHTALPAQPPVVWAPSTIPKPLTVPLNKPVKPVTYSINPTAARASVKDILKLLPELKNREPILLSQAVKKMRDAGLLGKTASSVLLFRHYSGQFELIPPEQPNAVKYRG